MATILGNMRKRATGFSLPVFSSVVLAFALMLGVEQAQAQNYSNQQTRNPVEHAILIYNGMPDSAYKIGLQMEPGRVPPRVIGVPVGLLAAGMTRAEAGALIAAVGVFMTPDLRERKVPQLDRTIRFDRLLRSFQTCPGALVSAVEKARRIEGGGFAPGLLHLVRTTDFKYAVPANPTCIPLR